MKEQRLYVVDFTKEGREGLMAKILSDSVDEEGRDRFEAMLKSDDLIAIMTKNEKLEPVFITNVVSRILADNMVARYNALIGATVEELKKANLAGELQEAQNAHEFLVKKLDKVGKKD